VGQRRARRPDHTGTATRDGVRLHFDTYGQGTTTVLLLPTWSIVDSRVWKAQVAFLARHYRVITFDGRGNGKSGRPSGAGAFTAEQFAADALAVLDASRGVLARGWTQHTWYVVETPAGRRRIAQRFFPSRVDDRDVVSACLVGAVLQGARRLSPRAEYAYPAIDALWRTLFDPDPDPDPDAAESPDPVGPLVPPLVRATRVRDLATWNDRSYRSREEVLRLVDRASACLARSAPPVPAARTRAEP